MSIKSNLVYFTLRQVVGDSVEELTDLIKEQFSDPGKALPKALKEANEKAWQTVELAILGESVFTRMKKFFTPGQIKGLTAQIETVLTQKGPDFRKQCVADWKEAKKRGVMDFAGGTEEEIVAQTRGFKRYSDPQSLIDGSRQVMSQVADDAKLAGFPALAELLRHSPDGETPLLVTAFGYFLRREIAQDAALFMELQTDALWKNLQDHWPKMYGDVIDIGETVRDLKQEGSEEHKQIISMLESMQEQLTRMGEQKGAIKPTTSFSIQSKQERAVVMEIIRQYRALSDAEKQQFPALVNGIGKLHMGMGQIDAGLSTFSTLAGNLRNPQATAEASFNAYQAALESKNWEAALDHLKQAAKADAERFEPFPLRKYEIKKILGAGGFGTAFLCHDRHMGKDVVIKTLHAEQIGRSASEIFREARILDGLRHPSIINVTHTDYADREEKHPYLVMEYFVGEDLEEIVKNKGVFNKEEVMWIARLLAEAMNAAHAQNILHRDLKPANILARKPDNGWKIKIIDFGLSLKLTPAEKEAALRSQGQSIIGSSYAGTHKFAPPEQTGERPGVEIKPYSDIFSFGKILTYLLFGTTQATPRNWRELGYDHLLTDLIDACVQEEPAKRPQSFMEVMELLKSTGGKGGVVSTLEDSEKETSYYDGLFSGSVRVVSTLEDSEKETSKGTKSSTLATRTEPEKLITISLPNLAKDAKPLEMMLIPAGDFMMGSPDHEKDRHDKEGAVMTEYEAFEWFDRHKKKFGAEYSPPVFDAQEEEIIEFGEKYKKAVLTNKPFMPPDGLDEGIIE